MFFGQLRVFDPEFFLDRNGTSHRLDRAAKLGDDAIASGTENAAIMLGDQSVDDLAITFEGFEGGFFVGGH